MAKKKSKPDDAVISFETSLESLKDIVAELEAGNLTLSDSLEKYEQGIASLKRCHDALAQTQKKIELLVKLDSDGKLVTRPFDDSATDSENGGVRRRTKIVNSEEDADEDSEADPNDDSDEDSFDDLDDRLDEEYGLF